MNTFTRWIVGVASGVGAVMGWGGSGALARQPADVWGALRGPAVPTKARSLVRHDTSGRLIRVEGRPEEAALAELPLEPERREKAREVIAERGAALRAHLVAQIDLVKESTDAIQAGETEKAQGIARELFQRFDPEQKRDPLSEPLAGVLTGAEHGELMRLVSEYWEAWIGSEQRGTREEMQDRLSFTLFQEEIGVAYNAALRPFREKLERIYEAVDPTPEQRAEIRQAVIDYIREARLKPTAEQRAGLARRIYRALDEERRIKLFELALTQF